MYPLRIDLADPTLFGNDAAEEESPEILASYFVDRAVFRSFFDRTRRLGFARARKGMGKSALLSKLAFDLRRESGTTIVISTTAADFTDLGEFASNDPSMLVNQWERLMCARITQEIGSRISVALSDQSMVMVEAAEVAGLKDRNVFRALFDRLKGKLAEVEVTRLDMPNPSALLQRHAENAQDMDVWLLVDDVDATFIDTPQARRKLGTFVTACRKIVREVRGLSIRASLRQDVWQVLRENEDLDKAEQYVTDIAWTTPEMETILAKRIAGFLGRVHGRAPQVQQMDLNTSPSQVIEFAFERRIKWGGHAVPPINPLNILCAKRPRWMAQLCRLAGIEAAHAGRYRIGTSEISKVMRTFGELRLSDLYKEHAHQFEGLRPIIESFANGRRAYSTRELRDHLKSAYWQSASKMGVPLLDGRPVASVLALAHFLFRIGFIQGRQTNVGGTESFFAFDDRPDLLMTEANLDDGLEWAIYPSYRSVLRIR